MKIGMFNLSLSSMLSLILIASIAITTVSAQCSDSGFLDSLDDLLRNQSELISSFEYLLHKTPGTIEEKVQFFASFEDLLRRNTILFSGFKDLLKNYWDRMDVEDQEKFLCSFEDLIERQMILLISFQELLDENYADFNHDEQIKFLSGFEDLIRRPNLLKSYEDLFKMKHGGISIEKSVDKAVIDSGETVTYTYVIKNFYRTKDIVGILITDNKLGEIVDNISLKPGETKSFTKLATLSESTCNKAKVMGQDPEGNLVCDESGNICVFIRGGGLPEPLQYSQYCEASKVEGSGIIDISTSLIDRNIALEYNKNLAGNGDVKLDSENLLSEKASDLNRPVGNKTMPLNFFEDTTMEYSGAVPLTGEKSLKSKQFYGGIGANIHEIFSVTQIENKQTSFFASTDPNTHVTNATKASILENESPVHLVGLDTKNSFNGTWGTESKWHEMFRKDLSDHQLFTGKFETEKLIKFHEKPDQQKENDCVGIDC